MTYQPRWLLYCRAHGYDPAETSPARNAAYIGWIGRRWREWDELVAHHGRGHVEADHEAFDAWLVGRVGAVQEELAL